MKTLLEYAHDLYPNRDVDVPGGDAELTEHTVVANAVGARDAARVEAGLREVLPSARIVVANVQPSEPSVIPTKDEDPEGAIDVPKRRVGTSAIVTAVIVGLAVGVIVGLIASSLWIGLISGVIAAWFAALAGTIVGAGKLAGDKAWEQPNAPGEPIKVLAAMVDSERDAVTAARSIERFGVYDVRVLDRDGAWHLPNT